VKGAPSVLEDAGIAYNSARVSFSEAAQFKDDKLKGQGWKPTLSFPIVEVVHMPIVVDMLRCFSELERINGEHLTQSYSILRYLGCKLDGVYDEKTHEEQYFVDVISDIVSDCTRFSHLNAQIRVLTRSSS